MRVFIGWLGVSFIFKGRYYVLVQTLSRGIWRRLKFSSLAQTFIGIYFMDVRPLKFQFANVSFRQNIMALSWLRQL